MFYLIFVFLVFFAILFTNCPLPIREKIRENEIPYMVVSTVCYPVPRETDPSEAKKRGVEITECVCEIEEDEASRKNTERIHTEQIGPVHSEAIGFLGLPFFRPNKMQVYNTTSRVMQIWVYDDENQTRSQVLTIHRSLLYFPSFVISLTCSAHYGYPLPHLATPPLATSPLSLSGQSYS
jgi:hypothetical protein